MNIRRAMNKHLPTIEDLIPVEVVDGDPEVHYYQEQILRHCHASFFPLVEALSATLRCRDCTRIETGEGCKGCEVSEKFNKALHDAEDAEVRGV